MKVTASFEIRRSDGDDFTPKQKQEVYELLEQEIEGLCIQIEVKMDGEKVDDELTITEVEVKGAK